MAKVTGREGSKGGDDYVFDWNGEELVKNVASRLVSICHEGAESVVKKAKENLKNNGSYDTGRLHDSGHVNDFEKSGIVIGSYAKFGDNIAYYAPWVEFDKPYLRPAFALIKKEIMGKISKSNI